jgi:glycine hydroxymethyltransferase
MGVLEMKEIAAIVKLVLDHTKSAITDKGAPAKGKIVLDEQAKGEAKRRVLALLEKHTLYPELDLAFLKKWFCASLRNEPIGHCA